MEAESSSTIAKQKIRHVTLVGRGWHASAFPEALRGQRELHSILLQNKGIIFVGSTSQREFSCDFKHFGSLRVFDASEVKMMHLSKSIGNSRHLTYLNLSRTLITELPASICSLHHLQTINLNWFVKLQSLPKKMHRLTGLRHLCLEGYHRIEDMPPKIGKLRQLKTLSLFVVGESDDQRLGELQHLDLGGKLELQDLNRVENSTEAKEANLAGKQNLCFLDLQWGYNDSEEEECIVERQEEVIEALKPHPNIKELAIQYYKGKELPSWMSDSSVLRNVVRICIIECRNCLGLPDLWHLPCLKCLQVIGGRRTSEMEYMFQNGNINLSGGGGGSATSATVAFVSLEELQISGIRKLKGLWAMEDEEEGTVHQQQQILFPRLRKMFISSCPRLVALPTLPAIECLYISSRSSVKLLASISRLTTLTSLGFWFNEDMLSFPEEMLKNLTLLQSLTISGCPEIVSLPDSIQALTQLQSLGLRKCSPEFRRRCEKEKGEDWYKIAHIPRVTIEE